MGLGYTYGGETVQGIVPAYFRGKLPPHRSKQVWRCVYDIQGVRPVCQAVQKEQIKVRIALCIVVSVYQMSHFTMCEKPWGCAYPRQDERASLVRKHVLTLTAGLRSAITFTTRGGICWARCRIVLECPAQVAVSVAANTKSSS